MRLQFQSATIILPVMNETHSLLKTIEVIEEQCGADVKEFLIVVSPRTKPESIRIAEDLQSRYAGRILLHCQSLPFLGGAIREGFDLASGSHVVMMASDLETDPADVKHFIRLAKQNPEAVITASRWTRGCAFHGYNKLKLLLNYVFQKLFSMLYATSLTDLTYGYRLFPVHLVKSIRWESLKHPFLFETIVKPLRLGQTVIEIPSQWKARVEGESQNTFLRNFLYFAIGLRCRFYSRSHILRPVGTEGRAA